MHKRGEELPPKVYTIPKASTVFKTYYDEVQELLKSFAGMDELLPG